MADQIEGEVGEVVPQIAIRVNKYLYTKGSPTPQFDFSAFDREEVSFLKNAKMQFCTAEGIAEQIQKMSERLPEATEFNIFYYTIEE
jgi:hypothetical protein